MIAKFLVVSLLCCAGVGGSSLRPGWEGGKIKKHRAPPFHEECEGKKGREFGLCVAYYSQDCPNNPDNPFCQKFFYRCWINPEESGPPIISLASPGNEYQIAVPCSPDQDLTHVAICLERQCSSGCGHLPNPQAPHYFSGSTARCKNYQADPVGGDCIGYAIAIGDKAQANAGHSDSYEDDECNTAVASGYEARAFVYWGTGNTAISSADFTTTTAKGNVSSGTSGYGHGNTAIASGYGSRADAAYGDGNTAEATDHCSRTSAFYGSSYAKATAYCAFAAAEDGCEAINDTPISWNHSYLDESTGECKRSLSDATETCNRVCTAP